MRILAIGADTSLLEPEDTANEGQYRQRRYCECLGQTKLFVIVGGPRREQQELAGGRLRAVGVGRGLAGLMRARAVGLRLARAFQPDLIEYQDPRGFGVVALSIARALRVPVVGGVFNDLLDDPAWMGLSPQRRLLNAAAKRVMARSRAVRCDSADTTAALRRKGFDCVQHIPFFVPWIERFTVSAPAHAARLAQWDREPVALCAARLAAEKNIPLLLRAFAAVPRGRLIITGSGPLKERLAQQAAALGIARRVTWAGFVDAGTLWDHFHKANVFILSSDTEASARVLIQAQAARLPTVTTDTAGSRLIVKDGRAGRVTPIGDAEALAAALRPLLTDRALYEEMLFSTDYYDYAQHSEAAVMPRLREFYQNALKR
ncbi:MAG: glycosyltransferase [Verrucomicrobia bacterium]|nr:glycosyltransferase [Verrucomicrobiota bacterium]